MVCWEITIEKKEAVRVKDGELERGEMKEKRMKYFQKST